MKQSYRAYIMVFAGLATGFSPLANAARQRPDYILRDENLPGHSLCKAVQSKIARNAIVVLPGRSLSFLTTCLQHFVINIPLSGFKSGNSAYPVLPFEEASEEYKKYYQVNSSGHELVREPKLSLESLAKLFRYFDLFFGHLTTSELSRIVLIDYAVTGNSLAAFKKHFELYLWEGRGLKLNVKAITLIRAHNADTLWSVFKSFKEQDDNVDEKYKHPDISYDSMYPGECHLVSLKDWLDAVSILPLSKGQERILFAQRLKHLALPSRWNLFKDSIEDVRLFKGRNFIVGYGKPDSIDAKEGTRKKMKKILWTPSHSELSRWKTWQLEALAPKHTFTKKEPGPDVTKTRKRSLFEDAHYVPILEEPVDAGDDRLFPEHEWRDLLPEDHAAGDVDATDGEIGS